MQSNSEPRSGLIFNGHIEREIIDLIGRAREYVYLVSPFNKYGPELRGQLKQAIKRDVRVRAICRSGARDRASVDWLARAGASVVSVNKLHAKIYMNESTALLTSMNLYERSSTDAPEVCVRVGPSEHASLREYVQDLRDKGAILRPQGHCIRCGKSKVFDREKPYHRHGCWEQWDKNDNHPEHYCHGCGQEYEITRANPLCNECA